MSGAPEAGLPYEEAFELDRHTYIFLIGGGGKTTLMFALARHLAARGREVLCTTSTKILKPSPADADVVIVEPDQRAAVARVQAARPAGRRIVVAGGTCEDGHKLCGYAPETLDHLQQARIADAILVEADGAAGRSLKAHAEHEPVVSPRADLVIAVIGSDCVACPLDDAHVHRAGRFAELLHLPPGAAVTARDVAAILFHPQGYLKNVSVGTDVVVLISKAGARREAALRLATALHGADSAHRIIRIVIGELVGENVFLERA